jgi:hypothetical protein
VPSRRLGWWRPSNFFPRVNELPLGFLSS